MVIAMHKYHTLTKIWLILATIIAPAVSMASDCNCEKIVGACNASIEFVKGFGTKPSYGAEIVIHSSEKTCSKVEYFVDSTPYQTILKNKQSEPESLFGSTPIKEKNISLYSCKVCSSTDTKEVGSSSNAIVESLAGRWRLNVSCPWTNTTDQIQLTSTGSGYSMSGPIGNSKIINGQIQGRQVRIEAQRWWNTAVYIGTLNDSNSMTGTMTQETNQPTCTWSATKQ